MSVVVDKSGLCTSQNQVKARALESGMKVWNQGVVESAVMRGKRVDVTFEHGTFAYEADEPVLLDA